MKVFISWSGDISHQVANVLRDWLPSVIQSLKPYVSSEDIDKGRRWIVDISGELENSSFGILSVTKESKDAPWLIFEAGALSKSVERSRVVPFLFGVELSEIKEGPLSQFQATTFDKIDVQKLVRSLNTAGDAPLSDNLLNKAFDRWWPDLEVRLNEIKVSKLGAKEEMSNSQEKDTDTFLQTVQQIEEVKDLVKEMKKELLEKLNAEAASKNPDEAARTVASVQRDPTSSPIDRAIATAVLLQQQGKIEDAIEKWRSIANVAGEENRRLQAQAWFSVGYLHSEGEGADLEAEMDAYTRAISLNPVYAEAYNNRGVVKKNLSQYDAALEDYDQAIRLNPNLTEAYNNRGNVKKNLGQHQAALADYDRAIELNPADAGAYTNRGVVKNELGQYQAALGTTTAPSS